MDKNVIDSILFVFEKLVFAREAYDSLKQNEVERPRNTDLGKRALFYDMILLIFMGGATALTIWGITMQSGWKIALFIVAGLVAIAMIQFYIVALNFAIKQLCLNKRAIGWISLLLPILITIASAAGITLTAFLV